MQQPLHSTQKIVFVTLMLATSALITLAQPRPVETGPSPLPNPSPGGVGPMISVSGTATAPMLPPMLQGVISADEYKEFTAFQQHVNDDPALKEINAKIATLAKELQQLRAEATATREKLIAANPEIKAIQDKIMSVMHTRGGPQPNTMPMPRSGPMPMPLPAKPN
jgi:uncharacterized small protein (DUF1192 family)